MSGTTPPLKRYTRWSRTSASDQNRLRDVAERLDRPDADPLTGVRISRTGGGMVFEEAEAIKDEFLIQITGGTTSPYTSWQEMVFNGTAFAAPGFGLAGNGTMTAREVNGVAVPSGTICRAWIAEDNASVNFVATGSTGASHTTLTYDTDTITFIGCTIGFTSTTIITLDSSSSLVINGELDLNTSPCWKRVARTITTSTTNDWSLSTEPWWVIDYNPGGGTAIVYGIVAPTCNRDIWITNTGKDSGTNNTKLQFNHEDATETTAARRFLTPDGANYVLNPQQTALLRYDLITARWRLFVTPPPAAGLTSPLTTKGDVWTYSSTDARIGVGTNGYIFRAESTATTGNEWAHLIAG